MLSIDPHDELVFKGPSNHTSCKSLVIKNPSKDKSVAFKLKTTSPRMFFVRPNVGILEPEEDVTVSIIMQPTGPGAGRKHRFLIQGAVIASSNINLPEFWKEQKPTDIWEAKIKCDIGAGKASDEELRQAGGGATGATAGKLDGKPESDSQAKLRKKVSMLEDERVALKEEIGNLHDQGMMRRSKTRGRVYFKFACCLLTMVAAIVGAYYGKHYM